MANRRDPASAAGLMLARSIQVQRRVHASGHFIISKQFIELGRAGKLVAVVIEDTHYRILRNREEIAIRPRRDTHHTPLRDGCPMTPAPPPIPLPPSTRLRGRDSAALARPARYCRRSAWPSASPPWTRSWASALPVLRACSSRYRCVSSVGGLSREAHAVTSVERTAYRVFIPKAGGKQRPLGIPVIADRVLQARVVNALKPEWEAWFEPIREGLRTEMRVLRGASVSAVLHACLSCLR